MNRIKLHTIIVEIIQNSITKYVYQDKDFYFLQKKKTDLQISNKPLIINI